MSNYWSQYWQQGHLTSFGTDIKNNYDGVLKERWSDFFKNFKHEDKVLDIGTGNGALIALAIANGFPNCQYTGVDYAQLNINDNVLLNRANVQFYSKTASENLPFKNQSFDHVISQFALEYTDLEQSIKEVSRTLKTQGSFKFVCHHEESIIVLPSKSILKLSIEIKAKGGLLEVVRKLVRNLSDPLMKANLETEALRIKLNQKMADLVEIDKIAFFNTNFPALIKNVFSRQSNIPNQEIIDIFAAELDGSILRLSDLVNSALTEKKIIELFSYCQKNDLVITHNQIVFQNDSDILGYEISGVKIGT